MESLDSEHTLLLARLWLKRDEFALLRTAEGVFSRWAAEEDGPLLSGHLLSAWTERSFYSVCNSLEALQRTGFDEDVAGLVEQVFESVEYSYARHLALAALWAHDQQRSAPHLAGAMWDSDSRVREMASEFASEAGVVVVGPSPLWDE